MLEKEFLECNTMYAPLACYEENDCYTLLRSPHIARNEEVLAVPLKDVGTYRQKYLSHLHYVIMVDSRSLIPERLGGADFDGDMIKTIAEPLVNICVKRSSHDLPLLKIPTAQPLYADASDSKARFKTVKDTFSSRVGILSNVALARGILAYDENISADEREEYRRNVETMAILTGLEIDSAKSGVKPILSEYVAAKAAKQSLFLRYKSISGNAERNPYEPTRNSRLKKFFDSVSWDKVTSNLEKLPYYAYMLGKETTKHEVTPAKDEKLFSFASYDRKERLDKAMLHRMEEVIKTYEAALSRVRYSKHLSTDMKRQNDVYRILFSRGQESEYSVNELYSAFETVPAHLIRIARQKLTDHQWQFTKPSEREAVFADISAHSSAYGYADLFCDFRCSGYRLLGDIICDFDDLYRTVGIQKHIFAQKNDSADMIKMLSGVQNAPDYKEQIIKNCISVMQPPTAKEHFDFEEAVKCAIALGKRQFVLEVLPATVLSLVCIGNEEKKIRRKRR